MSEISVGYIHCHLRSENLLGPRQIVGHEFACCYNGVVAIDSHAGVAIGDAEFISIDKTVIIKYYISGVHGDVAGFEIGRLDCSGAVDVDLVSDECASDCGSVQSDVIGYNRSFAVEFSVGIDTEAIAFSDVNGRIYSCVLAYSYICCESSVIVYGHSGCNGYIFAK